MTLDLSDVPPELRQAVAAALAGAGVGDGHLALDLVDADRMRELNSELRGIDAPTDVLAFPLDEAGPVSGPRELGDVVICPEHTADLPEAAVHGVLHLCGYDHETDEGEMLELQAQVLRSLRSSAHPPSSDRGSEGASHDHPPTSDRGSERPSRDNPPSSDRGSEGASNDHPPTSDRGSERASTSDSSQASESRGSGRNS